MNMLPSAKDKHFLLYLNLLVILLIPFDIKKFLNLMIFQYPLEKQKSLSKSLFIILILIIIIIVIVIIIIIIIIVIIIIIIIILKNSWGIWLSE